MDTVSSPSEEIIYEQADHVPDHGQLFFITVVQHDAERKRDVYESRVFIPQQNLHLHELKLSPRDRCDEKALLATGIEATHRLFADQLARDGNEHALGQQGFSYATRRVAAHPFYGFQLRNQFRNQMWEIQDWTISPTLRNALAQITRYRTDSAEAELLGRIFAKA